MKRTHKGSIVSLMLMMVLTLGLSGCGGNGNNQEGKASDPPAKETANATKSSSGPEATADPASELKPYTVKLIYVGAPQKDEKQVEDEINKLLEPKINAKLDIAPIDWGDWDSETNLKIASREPFDLIFTAQWRHYVTNAAKGAYLALNDDGGPAGNLLKEYGQGILESLDPLFLKGSAINGVNYGVPTNKELAAQGGVVYRSDIAQDLGIDMSGVKSIQDLDAVLKVVKEKRADVTPLYFKQGETFNSQYMAQYDTLGDASIPGVLLKDSQDTTIKSMIEMDRYKEIVKLTREYMKKGYINADAAIATTSTQDAMKAGNVFMTVQSLKPGKDSELANATGLVGKLKQIAFNDPTVSTSDAAGSMLAVSASSADPARAMMVLNLLHTDKEINNLLVFGIKGVHYEVVSGDTIKATDKTPDYNTGAAWMLGSQFLNPVWESEAPDKWEQFKAFNAQGKATVALGYNFDGSKMETEMAACKAVMDEFDTSLDTGTVDPDTVLTKYAEKLKKAGVEKIIAEKQKQLDEFLAAQK
ncbi:ABC transporter substrate-binding protein [Paenibacillus tepidiphilus]|uniref:ABC transporter substrate-binding protein n=1 Tax=Paenibacillus tepidiphilus TaxID=2608683 RepID=UPI001239EDE1|nr:ABC transporter substrate-binding protein [Paenibacillus tepidiphilus]